MNALPEGSTALGAYFWTLRGARSRADLAAEMGVSEMSILRIETQGQKPKTDMLKKLVAALHARWEDIDYLADLKGSSQAEEGMRLAEQVRSQLKSADTPSDRKTVIQSLIKELEDDPRKLDQLIDYGRYLRSQDQRHEEN